MTQYGYDRNGAVPIATYGDVLGPLAIPRLLTRGVTIRRRLC